LNIRTATREDLPAILGLVQELADYEKEPDAVTCGIADYEKDFDEGNFFAHVAEEDSGKIVGMTVYYIGFSTWNGRMLFLEDFFVQESQRRKGTGKLLFEAVIEHAKELDVKRIKWQVLDWNEPAIKFYEKYDAVFQKGWWNVNLYENALG
jgi:GNAT superfamily N-acetyltransferase